MFKNIKQKIINWCLNVEEVAIGDVHNFTNAEDVEIFNNDILKFIEKSSPDVYVKTPSGYSPIKASYKTVEYNTWAVHLADGRYITGADEHIVILSNGVETFIKNLTINDEVVTEDGSSYVTKIENFSHSDNMYDLELDDDAHVYYTNGILSHNTETSAAFLLWWAIFKSSQTILIASNKSANAMEVIGKIQYAYEELPDWLKPGVDPSNYNKLSMSFDNKSRIIATTTSEDSGRGLAISLLYCDEFGFVRPAVAASFWDSILPTISTGGSVIISSTPNGDVGKFAELWRGARAGINEFKNGAIHVPWDAPPGRDAKFKKDMIGLLGERKWRQEYECEFLSEELTLIDGSLITPAELRINERIESDTHIKHTGNNDKFQFYEFLKRDVTYLVGCDPSTGNGSDNGAIQVFEFPAMVQVLEYSTNTLSPQVLYTELKSVLRYLEQATEEIYFSIENNGVGQGVLAAYEGDPDPPIAALVSDVGGKSAGVNSNVKSKLRACIQFKEAFERGRITINSADMLKELKSFVRHAGSYAAQVGSTDDRVMACMVCYYIIQQLAANNGDAYDMIHSVASDIEERHGWTPPNEIEDASIDPTEALRLRNESMSREFNPFSQESVMDEFYKRLHGETNDTGIWR